ncbi:hypothetical protein GPS60_11510 [Acinetobacter haemolyticus]|uniref:tetratricopeptide repeat protein n=1 Tax=Acinetobacter haemolyticus TaxID=29430 RepID=UPI00137343B1|nr:tetratricopeptide repeat protein [Acinetobacter haemolyticus]NAR48248.1 hypothetical protein [Acinetobacter haemolyticus]
MNKRIYLIIILIFSVSTHVYADNYFNEQLVLANKGNPQAQINIGKIYANGMLDIPPDAKKAFEWYSKAAELGNADAQLKLAFMYDGWNGINEDKGKAFEWCTKAANQDHVYAQVYLGLMYEAEENILSYKRAFEWYSKAANKGFADGQYHLGRMYASGLGVKQNKNLALQWLKKAADQGNISAISEIEEINNN